MPAWTIAFDHVDSPVDVGDDTIEQNVVINLYFTRGDVRDDPLAGQVAVDEAIGAMIADRDRYDEWSDFVMEVLRLVIKQEGYPEARIEPVTRVTEESPLDPSVAWYLDELDRRAEEPPTMYELTPVSGGVLLDFPVGPEPTRDPDLD